MGRSVALATTLAVLAAACGQPRLATPPAPQFTTGQRAEPTVVVDSTGGMGTEPILASEIESDVVETELIDVGRMQIIDDAGNAAPNLSGWQAFDDSIAARLVPANVSASLAVMIDGVVVHEAAFGERVAGGGDPVDVGDRFRIASISKMITAIVTMQLVEDGTLALDDPIGTMLVRHLGLTSYDPDVPSITVRDLLGHTAGFPQHENMFFSNGATSCVDAATQGLARSVSGGASFRYSNMSYCVLGILIEAVSGKTYERVVYERLLTPLGIGGMRMSSTYDLGPDEVSHHPTLDRNYMETLGAAGAWNATPTDLVTIINSIDHSTPGWKAVSPETAEAMRYRVPTDQPPAGYGLGLINYDDGFGHTGTIQNTHAMVLVQPDGVTWAVTVSGEYPSDTPQLRHILRNALVAGFATA